MSCKYCKGEKLLYTRESQWYNPDALEWLRFHLETKIINGHVLFTVPLLAEKNIGGMFCKINFCPMCGAKVGDAKC